VRIKFGKGGWVQVDGIGLPGPLYARFVFDEEGRPRASEIYVDGDGQTLSTAILRQLRLDLLEAAVLEDGGHLQESSRVPGPDLRRLAAHFGTSWGSLTYDGQHCDRCGGPVKGGLWRRRQGRTEAMQNWVAESFFAQMSDAAFPELPARIKQVPMPKKSRPPGEEAEELPVLEPPAGRRMTDDFLREVARAYAVAARKGRPPAPSIAEVAGVTDRAVHKWIYTARKRGIMPPGTRGRVG
jgi:hypothetical protein